MQQGKIFIQTSIGLFMLEGSFDNICISEFEGRMEFRITTQDQHYYEFPEVIVQSVWDGNSDQYHRTFYYQRQIGAAAEVARSE